MQWWSRWLSVLFCVYSAARGAPLVREGLRPLEIGVPVVATGADSRDAGTAGRLSRNVPGKQGRGWWAVGSCSRRALDQAERLTPAGGDVAAADDAPAEGEGGVVGFGQAEPEVESLPGTGVHGWLFVRGLGGDLAA